jgi:hypothetical protein
MSFSTTLHHRIGNWSRRRHEVDTSPVQITNRRIYILPTRLGLMYAFAVVAMGIGGMNTATIWRCCWHSCSRRFVAMHHTHRNLAGLRIHAMASEPVFAGQLAQLQLSIEILRRSCVWRYGPKHGYRKNCSIRHQCRWPAMRRPCCICRLPVSDAAG